jgi:hypothetical protein
MIELAPVDLRQAGAFVRVDQITWAAGAGPAGR